MLSANAFGSDKANPHYEVKTGDSFSQAVKQFCSSKSTCNSYISYSYQSALLRFKEVNPHIEDVNTIHAGDKIFIPSEYTKETQKLISKYKIKYGDTLFSIIEHFFKNEEPHKVLKILKEMHPRQLTNINFIKANDYLSIPSLSYVNNYKVYKKAPSRKLASGQVRFEVSFKLQREIYDLQTSEAKKFIPLFLSIVNSSKKVDVVQGLKDSLELARKDRNFHLEECFLGLISSALRSREDELYLEDIKTFFKNWKRLRNEKRYDSRRSL
jgi:hypothetical protein